MTASRNTQSLAERIRQVYSSNPLEAQGQIEAFLEEEFSGSSSGEKLNALDALVDEFTKKGVPACPDEVRIEESVLTPIFSFLIGKKVSPADLSSTELLKRLADSLNTIFDSLNQLIGVINMTFMGQQNGLETIRQVIGFHLKGDDHGISLESYLGQISKAFLTAQQAFKLAAEKKMKEVLAEIDPERIRDSVDGGFKFGRSRRAESFELYAEKYKTLKKWIDSGRFMEDLLREFESNSQKLFLR